MLVCNLSFPVSLQPCKVKSYLTNIIKALLYNKVVSIYLLFLVCFVSFVSLSKKTKKQEGLGDGLVGEVLAVQA